MTAKAEEVRAAETETPPPPRLMSRETAETAIAFLERVPLQGKEVDAYLDVRTALRAIAILG